MFIDFHSVLCAPVWKGIYAFVGLCAASIGDYKIRAKNDCNTKRAEPRFVIGPIVLGFLFAEDAIVDPQALFRACGEDCDLLYPRKIAQQLKNHRGYYTTLWANELVGRNMDFGSIQHYLGTI